MKVWRRVGVVVLAAALAGCAHVGGGEAKEAAPAKKVILMIGDGMGFNAVCVTSLYEYGEGGRLEYESFPVRLACSTYSADGTSYDPAAALSGFNFPKAGATDSAAAATALATGVRTHNGMLGLGPDGQRLANVREYAESLGKSTGVVTTVPFSHATPAGFVAHNPSRNDYEGIAREMLGSDAEVIMGCGHPEFDADGARLAAPADYSFVGGADVFAGLLDGTLPAADCDRDGTPDPWAFVQRRDEFVALRRGEAPKRVVGVAQVAQTLQQDRGGDAMAPPYEVPLTESVPTLAQMTQAALNVLDDDPDGFFVMVEGGAIDWTCHASQPGRLVEEMVDFQRAVEAVVAWVEGHGGWRETLVIVTADHETGYIWGPGSGETWEPVVGTGLGRLPLFTFYYGDHTTSLVPLYARGAGADLLRGKLRGTDPVRGSYVDNTDVANAIREAMGGE